MVLRVRVLDNQREEPTTAVWSNDLHACGLSIRCSVPAQNQFGLLSKQLGCDLLNVERVVKGYAVDPELVQRVWALP